MYNAFNRPKTEPAEPGKGTEPEYSIQITQEGKKELIETGETDVYSMIQESYESTKIENIIRRATLGDEGILQLNEGQYIDITKAPTSLAEMQNLLIKTKEEFDKLPIEVRKKFDMSPEMYVAQYGSTEWAEKLKVPNVGLEKETVKETVKENAENE